MLHYIFHRAGHFIERPQDVLERHYIAAAARGESLRRSEHLLCRRRERYGGVGVAVVRQLLHGVAEGCEKRHFVDVHLLKQEWQHVAVGLHDGHHQHCRLQR